MRLGVTGGYCIFNKHFGSYDTDVGAFENPSNRTLGIRSTKRIPSKDAKTLSAAIERINGMCEKGEDTGYGKAASCSADSAE